jgi:choline-sulfatase
MPRRAAVVASCLAVVGLLGWLVSRCPAEAAPPNLLIVSVDALRADHVGCYGYAAAATPTLDALAARGLRFEQATTVAPLTLPAHSSLMTGCFPARHRVRDDAGFILGDGQTTLAEVLKERGYRTGGFVSSFALDSRFGIQQGFSRYFDDFDPDDRASRDPEALARRGDETVAKALEWLSQEAGKPFFVWVHLADPHAPYQAPDPYPDRRPATLAGAYDAEIAWTDSLVGRLLARLGRRRERTVVVVVGAYGESLGEHGEREHGFFVYDATVQVPLVMAGPGVPRRTVPDQVRIVDVMPTVLELLGVPSPASVQGGSLLPLARGERLELVALCESWRPLRYGWSGLVAARDGRHKLVEAPRPELYDLRADGPESHNLYGEDPATGDEAALRLVLASDAPEAALSPEDGPAADPKDRIGTYERIRGAEEAASEGRYEEAVSAVREALSEDPGVQRAHVLLGEFEARAGRPAQAVEAYGQALALDPKDAAAAYGQAVQYGRLERNTEAEAGFERVHALDPRETRSLWHLADIAIQKGRFDQAEALLTEGLAKKGDRPLFLLKLGECYVEMKRPAEAEAALSEAGKARPGLPDLHYQLGRLQEARGDLGRAHAEYEEELRRFPSTWRASVGLAKLALKERRPQEAAARLRDALAASPEFGDGFVYLARALLESGDPKGARDAALQGLRSSLGTPSAALAHRVLADAYTRLGRPGDAAREAAAARKLERKS